MPLPAMLAAAPSILDAFGGMAGAMGPTADQTQQTTNVTANTSGGTGSFTVGSGRADTNAEHSASTTPVTSTRPTQHGGTVAGGFDIERALPWLVGGAVAIAWIKKGT